MHQFRVGGPCGCGVSRRDGIQTPWFKPFIPTSGTINFYFLAKYSLNMSSDPNWIVVKFYNKKDSKNRHNIVLSFANIVLPCGLSSNYYQHFQSGLDVCQIDKSVFVCEFSVLSRMFENIPKSQLVYQAQPTTTKPRIKIGTYAHKLDAKDIAGQVPRGHLQTLKLMKGESCLKTHI